MKYWFVLVTLLASTLASASETPAREDVERLMELSDADAMMETTYQQMNAMMKNMAGNLGIQPDEQHLFDEFNDRMTALLRERVNWASMEPKLVDIYQRNFTQEEIDHIIAFYESETGQAMLEKMPTVMQESMMVSQQAVQAIMPDIQQLAVQFRQDLQAFRSEQAE